MSEQDYVTPEQDPEPRRRRAVPWIALAGAVLAVVAIVVIGSGLPSVGTQAAPPTSDAQPYLRDFANSLEGSVRPPLPEAQAESYSYGESLDGCDHDYGEPNVCVPWNFPPQVAKNPQAKCAYLAFHEFGALEVHGEDRHRLAPAGGPRSPAGKPYACPDVLPTG